MCSFNYIKVGKLTIMWDLNLTLNIRAIYRSIARVNRLYNLFN